MTLLPTIFHPSRAPLQNENERERIVLCRWVMNTRRNVLTRCGWTFGHSRAPETLRLCASAVKAPSFPSPLRARSAASLTGSKSMTGVHGWKAKRKRAERTGSRPQENPTGLFNKA
jgi:hypothetical protein